MKISIIIPNYNHASYLEQRINSVLNQTYKNYEVIILDDCSTDNSREIIESYQHHPKISHIIYNKKNSGSPFIQWEKGVSLAKGEYIWIAESDDWCDLNFLEISISEILKYTNVGICFSGSNWVDSIGIHREDLSIYSTSFFKSGITEIKEALIYYNTIQNVSSALIKKEFVTKYIQNILPYKSCGDWRLYIDILYNSNVVFISQKLNNYRWYHNNISNYANETGLWTKEGISILATSQASRIKFSNNELTSIVKFWLDKTTNYKYIKLIKYKTRTSMFLLFFVIKCLWHRWE